MAENNLFSRVTVPSLLQSPQEQEEFIHPWGSTFSVNIDSPLLRTWDYYSGSQPNNSGECLARLPRGRLDTSEIRKDYLTIHADHKIWEPTPFISFTQSSQELQDNANWRMSKRGSQTITVVNANVRVDKGLPVLNMADEMRYYGVSDPYNRRDEYYRNHYICLWEITEEEIVGNWEWDELLRNGCWYEQVILPAFKEHNNRYMASKEAFKLSALWDALFDV
ncbi:uncharacterized protein BO72DRAFT_180675 [Aspergillus fijiensis CBS 313.89]|uniref:DUF7587 domain-containing protein n=1 Tax=Aspergillus fijiensis CBS 313.89 TaxID=1448319 RepID=A0A8G1S3M9_9EURO|nr:uncharacterized protein BO72DRAFT_180675 [Aspergillus fijiensis CBS 313.89]RAK81891.1 hypothetical protein BO72DRAFT_180675 [Aspergillus fijiensis CBS 313.89]